MICHGGHNTVCETLAHGVPLVVAPIRDDQPVVAEQVVNAGAGIRLRFGRATPEIIRDAVAAVLTEPEFRAGAAAVKASFDRAGAADAAAQHLLAVARTRPTTFAPPGRGVGPQPLPAPPSPPGERPSQERRASMVRR